MIPIQDLLSQIRWDRSLEQEDFVIGYYDRIDDLIIEVPLKEVRFVPGNRFSFQVIDPKGHVHEVPFHRVREVCRNRELIWYRKMPPSNDDTS